MKRGMCLMAAAAVLMAASTDARAGAVDLTDLSGTGATGASGRSVYNYDIDATAADIVKISFDYDYGNASNISTFAGAAFRIRRLNTDGTDSWLGSFNIHSGSYNLDTDYGPSVSSGPLSTGIHHYAFTMNRTNGVWDLALDGVSGVLVGPAAAGYKNYFSDESPEAKQNAIDLGYSFLTDGLGGTGAYRLQFEQAAGGSVDNIAYSAVPLPAALVPGLAMLAGAGIVSKLRSRRSKSV